MTSSRGAQRSHLGTRRKVPDELTWTAGDRGPDGGFLKDSPTSYSPALLMQLMSPLPTAIGPDKKRQDYWMLLVQGGDTRR